MNRLQTRKIKRLFLKEKKKKSIFRNKSFCVYNVNVRKNKIVPF